MNGTAAHGNTPPQPPSASVLTLRPTTPDPDKSVATTGLCEVQLANGLALTFELAPGGDTLFLHVPVGRAPADPTALAAFCEDLLRRNDLEEAGEDGALGI